MADNPTPEELLDSTTAFLQADHALTEAEVPAGLAFIDQWITILTDDLTEEMKNMATSLTSLRTMLQSTGTLDVGELRALLQTLQGQVEAYGESLPPDESGSAPVGERPTRKKTISKLGEVLGGLRYV